jgi:YidC/Oxa1 family membrane protein insertase
VEKRAVIAFLLMFLVLVGHMVLTSRGRRVAPAETPASEVTGEPARPEEVIDQADTISAGTWVEIGLPKEAASAKRVVVVTPLYTARLSTAGGVIESFRLHEYLSGENAPVELIPEAAQRPLGLVLHMDDGRRLDLSGSVWSVSTDSLVVGAGAEAPLRFELETEGGLRVTKTCLFRGDTYLFGVDIRVSGTGSDLVRRLETGWGSGLRVTETHREKDDLSSFATLTLTEEGIAKSRWGAVKDGKEVSVAGDIRWAAVKTKYFLAAVIPVEAVDARSHAFAAGEHGIGITLDTEKPDTGTQEFLVYAGPLDYGRLKQLGYGLDRAVDFGWSFVSPLSRLVFRFLLLVHEGIPNYGVVIILLSALTKLLFWPLTQKSFTSMREMQKLQPAMAELKEKHKNDPQKLNKAMMELYRERGVNPLGGCFPMLLQMPVFIALFNVLRTTIELRQAPFMLWIKDLSSPDVIAHMPFSLPFMGNDLSLLPILMGVAMFVQQKMQSTDPKQAALTYMMPILFTFLFFRFPSGLVLYWLVNNVLTIGHQYLIGRNDRAQEA